MMRHNHHKIQTKTNLTSKLWVPKIGNKIKAIIKSCHNCKRATGVPFKMPSSGPLTKLRVTFRPYEILGIDATGHIWLKNTDTNRKEKYYIIIFTCANIRHINLELVSDTSTKSVLDALKVHSGTYGAPKIIMADNASYFKASEKLR